MDLLFWISVLFCDLVAVKALIIGSDFNFINWFKFGREYSQWYLGRETFEKFQMGRQNERKKN